MKHLKNFDTLAGLTTAVADCPIAFVGRAENGGAPVVRLGRGIPNDEIWYTSDDNNSVTLYDTDNYLTLFGASFVSNTYSNGKGVIKFDRPVTSVQFSYLDEVTLEFMAPLFSTIQLPNSVTSIGEGAFAECDALTSVTIPNSVTSIGSYAFSYCDSLTSVTIPDSVTSIGESTFEYSKALTSVTIGNGVTSISVAAFMGCTGLTSVTIGNGVTSIGESAFSGCNNLTSVNIPNSVTSIGYSAFHNCDSLTSVTIGNSVASIAKDAFLNCAHIDSLNIPNSVTSIADRAFDKVLNVNYSGSATGSPWGARCVNGYMEGGLCYTDSTKTTLAGASATFSGSVTIPNGMTAIGNDAFYGCTGLTSVTIPNSVTSIGNTAFYGCTGLTSVTIPNSVTSIGNSAFSRCTGLTSVTIPNGVTTIDGNAFYGCTGLTSVTIPNSVTSIGNSAFSQVLNVNYTGTATGSPWGARYVNGYVEGGLCYTDSTKTTLVGAPGAISGSVTIPNGVTSIGNTAFYGCTGLTSVTIPNSVTSIGQGAFDSCIGLTSVTIPNSVTSIGNSAFSQVLNVNYTGTATGSPWGARCVNGYIEGGLCYTDSTKTTLAGAPSAITGSVTIPNGVTSIGYRAFISCSSLASVTIPSSVTSISFWAFTNCTGLTSITCEPTTPPTLDSNNAFDGTNNCPIYVPAASVDTYKAANNWSSLASRIQAIQN